MQNKRKRLIKKVDFIQFVLYTLDSKGGEKMEEWLKAIGTFTGGLGALIASIAKLIEVIKKDDPQKSSKKSK